MTIQCNTPNDFGIGHFVVALLGLNNGLSDGKAAVRFIQVESVGDYIGCEHEKEINTPEELFHLLIDYNICNHPAIRVDVTTDDGLCTNFTECNNKEMDAFTALKFALGVGADGAPVLRIMMSDILS